MAELIYLNNPADRTVTWFDGRTYTWEFLAYCRAAGWNPWLGVPTGEHG